MIIVDKLINFDQEKFSEGFWSTIIQMKYDRLSKEPAASEAAVENGPSA